MLQPPSSTSSSASQPSAGPCAGDVAGPSVGRSADPPSPSFPASGLTPADLVRYNRPGPRYTSYPPIPFWKETVRGDADYRAALHQAGRDDSAVSLYVHLPFCAARCSYCGCNATVTNRASVVDAYLDRLETETRRVAESIGTRKAAIELHWGGGTPNFLSIDQMSRVLDVLGEVFDLGGAEQSIEIDPRIATPAQVEQIRALGFTRISLGVQDMHPRVQEAIGRIQPESLTREIFGAARAAGFDSVNLDLVYGLPYQTLEVFDRTLEAVVDLRPDRISCFSYAHLPHLRPNQKQVDARGLPATPWDKFQLFERAVARFEAAGWTWIGMDHFALEQDPLSQALRERRLHRNFMGYVERAAPHLIGFGTSAIGEVAGYQVQNDPGLGRWQRGLEAGGLPVVRGHHLTPDDFRRREAIHHLLCNLELPRTLLAPRPGEGGSMLPALDEAAVALGRHVDDGLLEVGPDGWVVTPRGRWFLRNICMELDAYLQLATPDAPPVEGTHQVPRFSMTV
jgi:oxygen-independent coproporphyrinogen III oxidase